MTQELNMSVQLIKKLESLKENKKSVEEKIDSLTKDVANNLAHSLIQAGALHVDLVTLTGGILEAIEKVKSNTGDTEAWKKSGQKFLQQTTKRTTRKSPSKAKKAS